MVRGLFGLVRIAGVVLMLLAGVAAAGAADSADSAMNLINGMSATTRPALPDAPFRVDGGLIRELKPAPAIEAAPRSPALNAAAAAEPARTEQLYGNWSAAPASYWHEQVLGGPRVPAEALPQQLASNATPAATPAWPSLSDLIWDRDPTPPGKTVVLDTALAADSPRTPAGARSAQSSASATRPLWSRVPPATALWAGICLLAAVIASHVIRLRASW